jgi:tRNA dimethylallyltransferase
MANDKSEIDRPKAEARNVAMADDSQLLARTSVVFLVGPTGVGKSEVAMRLAHALGGEIISADSMQVYRGLDIGTAKPSGAERAAVRHHLIDVLDLQQSFDAAQFVTLSRAAVVQIRRSGHVPIFCGGTGLYIKAFLEGLGTSPPADNDLRAELQALSLPELLRELEAKDPETYERIDRKNPRRVIRAVEVIRLTGKPFRAQRAEWVSPAPGADRHGPIFGLTRAATDLADRINVRVNEMFHRGLVEETEQLLKRGLMENPTVLQALGYRQVVEFLQGVRSLPETIELVKCRTRQYAKRQMTWFRRQLSVRWVQLEPRDTPESTSKQIRALLYR